ncbi:MAG: efflux RND transporter periplasmic adaptor subunit [Gemmatimonadetes bacterium]|nr:efflux RND transporter periplasmic adaptor subunit [Gemmatimonadota bacterium]
MSGMNRWRSVWTGASRRTRRVAVAGAIAGVAVIGTLAVAASGGGEEKEPRGQARTGEMAGMEGMDMAGMNMSGDGSVQLTAGQISEFGITFAFAEQRTLSDEVRTVGIVNFDETRIAQMAPKFSGFVERLYVDFTGKPVRRGQPLLEIYSPELVAAQEELLLAGRLQRTMGESSVPGVGGGSPDLVAAARRRLLLWDVSPAQVDEVLRSGRVRRTLTLHAPVSGVVVEKPVVRGQAVAAGQTLYTIADLTEVWVEAELREADAATVQEGTPATVELAAFPGRPIAGTVEYVYPTLQQEARTLKARISVPNPGGRLKPGMYATVRLAAPGRTALTIPASALVRTGERTLVFVDLGGGRLAPQEVEVGRVGAEYAEILAGVEPGQRVVTSAQFLLDSESNLAEVMRSMVGMGGDMGGMDMGGMDMSGGGMEGMDMKGADVKGMQAPSRRDR